MLLNSNSSTSTSTLLGLMGAKAATSTAPLASSTQTVVAATPVTSAPAAAPTAPVVVSAPVHQTTVTVNSAAGLTAALKTALPGDTIKLAAGVYSGVVLSNLNFNKAVTITSADASHPAVFSGLKVASSSGLAFDHVELTTVGANDPYYAFRVASSQNISFNHVDAHGDMALAPSAQVSGFYISQSSGVTITNSTVHDLSNGVIANNNQGLTFTNSTYSSLNKGGVEMGGNAGVLVSGNTFTNFQVGAGIHADAVQLYTVGTTTAGSDTTITNNLITRGSGDPIQGIFVQDEAGNLPYHNLTITDNSVVGGMWNSIYVNADVTGVLNVSNNLATSWAGADKGAVTTLAAAVPTTSFLGGITLNGDFSGADVTETGNVAQRYIANQASAPPPSGNTVMGAVQAVTNLQDLQTKVTAPDVHASVLEHGAVSGNVLSGASGGSLYLADLGVGAGGQKMVGADGLTVAGAYGSLTVHQDGSYSYTETKNGLVIGQTYTDHFTTTVANQSGQGVSSTLDIVVTGSGVGDGGKDTIIGGAGDHAMSGFGGGSVLVGGPGHDTFVFDHVSQSTPTVQTQIQNFQAGDMIDLWQLDPQLHAVSKFDGHAHELVVLQLAAGNWWVEADTMGTGAANFLIHVTGAAGSLTADSFHL